MNSSSAGGELEGLGGNKSIPMRDGFDRPKPGANLVMNECVVLAPATLAHGLQCAAEKVIYTAGDRAFHYASDNWVAPCLYVAKTEFSSEIRIGIGSTALSRKVEQRVYVSVHAKSPVTHRGSD
jgi:hypothetical protein